MDKLNEIYKDKAIIKRCDDELLKYEINFINGWCLDGTIYGLGKYSDDTFESEFENETHLYCYNINEIRRVIKQMSYKGGF